MRELDTKRLVSMLSVTHARFAAFVGAGVSVSAGIPLATTDLPGLPSIATTARQHVFCSNNPGMAPTTGNVDQWFAEQRLLPTRGGLYGGSLELVSPTARGRRDFLSKFFKGKAPATAHISLAQLMNHKVFPVVFTTNFDDLLEKALDTLHVDYTVYSGYDVVDDVTALDVSPKILKLHGDYRYSHICNIKSETQQLEARQLRAFLHLVREYGLVFFGYGGHDHSIMQPLCEHLAERSMCPYGLVWVTRNHRTLPTYVHRLLRAAPDRAFVLTTSDLESLLDTLYTKLVPLVRRAQDALSLPAQLPQKKLRIQYFRRSPEIADCFIDRESELKKVIGKMVAGVVLIRGVPGSGKTYLATRLYEQSVAQCVPTFWYTLTDCPSRDLYRLYSELAGFLAETLEDRQVLEFLECTEMNPGNEQFVGTMICELLNRYSCRLIFDDFQHVTLGTLLGFCQMLSERARSYSVVLVSRSTPPFLLSRKGISYVETDVVGFNSAAIYSFFERRGFPIQVECCERIKRHFAGLPQALDLLMAYAKLHGLTPDELGTFVDSAKDFMAVDFVADIYKSFHPDERLLLRVLSASPEMLSLPALHAVLPLSPKRTNRLLTSLLTVSVLKTDGSRYGVHAVLRDFAYRQLRNPVTVHRRLADICLADPMDVRSVLAGVEHLVRAKEHKRAANQVLLQADHIIRFGSSALLQHVIDTLDVTQIDEHTWLLLQYVRVRMLEQVGEFHIAASTLGALKRMSSRAPGALLYFHYYSGRIAYFQGRFASARVHMHRALDIVRTRDNGGYGTANPVHISESIIIAQLARVHYIIGYLGASETLYDYALQLSTSAKDAIGINKIVHRIAMIASDRGETRRASELFQQVQLVSRRLNDKKRLAYASFRLGNLAILEEDYATAASLHQESMDIKKEIGHHRGLVFSYRALARIAFLQGDCDHAMSLIEESIRIGATVQDKKEHLKSLMYKAVILNARSREAEGAAIVLGCLAGFKKVHLLKQCRKAHLFLCESSQLSNEEREYHRREAEEILTKLDSRKRNDELARRYLPESESDFERKKRSEM